MDLLIPQNFVLNWGKPRSLQREWMRPWPGKRRSSALPWLHLVAFDSELFACHDAENAKYQDLGWNDAISRSAPRRQAEFFYGRWAARSALVKSCLPSLAVPIGVAGAPLWPPNTLGSISHIEGLAAATVSSTSNHARLGLDIERTAVGDSQKAMRGLVVDCDELQLLESVDASQLNLLVTLAFSAKESLYKAAYPTVGRFFDFTAARVVSVDLFEGQLVLQIVEPLGAAFEIGTRWPVDFDFIQNDTVLTAVRD